jgi:hypothetical protein
VALSLFLLAPALGAAADFLGKWGTNGKGDGQFQTVEGIATDTHGHVYVADSYRSMLPTLTTTASSASAIVVRRPAATRPETRVSG